MLPGKSRTYHDPLHGAITLRGDDPVEALLIRCIDTPEFQRLRRIRQLDVAAFTFHGAEGSRFTHSLGVMALTRRAFDAIARLYPVLWPHRAVALVSALLHDLGHSPFSHAGEEMFGSHHERWTVRLVQPLPADMGARGIGNLLADFDPALPDGIARVFAKQYPIPFVRQLVSSQLDCDRLDYLQRDSYFTGAQYGRLDLDRILKSMQFDPVTQRLVVSQKGLVAIEHYLMVRYFMYLQVYNHPKNLAARFVLGGIFQRARELLAAGQLEADPVVSAWLCRPNHTLSREEYLQADDTVLTYPIHRWRYGNDPILRDLCRRYLDRDLLRATDISDRGETERQHLLAHMQAQLAQRGLDPRFYCTIRVALTKGYTLYQQGIDIQTTEGLKEIAELSALVKTIAQPVRKAWLVHP